MFFSATDSANLSDDFLTLKIKVPIKNKKLEMMILEKMGSASMPD